MQAAIPVNKTIEIKTKVDRSIIAIFLAVIVGWKRLVYNG
jgi:hypothetical protein